MSVQRFCLVISLFSLAASTVSLPAEHVKYLCCSARASAIPFYQKYGYRAEGSLYNEDGIPHLEMKKCLARKRRDMAQVIYINGPSSAGKSTLTRALQNVLPETYLRIGIDPMIGMMPERLNDWQEGVVRTPLNVTPGFCWDFQLLPDGTRTHRLVRGPEGARISDLFHTMARTMLLSGYSIIIDDVALGGKDDIARWRETLQGFPVLWVGLVAPLSVLEERERARGDRAIGSSRVQLATIHNETSYDLFFDSSQTSLDEMVRQIVEKIQLNK